MRCVMYKNRRFPPPTLGYSGSMMFVKLSDGRIVVTNDLWDDTDSWVSAVPTGSLIGKMLKTHICSPKSKQALVALLEMLVDPGKLEDGCGARWVMKSGLSDIEARDLARQYIDHQLPEVASRTYRESDSYSTFWSPEGAILTHFKIGDGPVTAFNGLKQLDDVDPKKAPVYIFYTKDDKIGLQKGDVIDATYVYEVPGWSSGDPTVTTPAHVYPRKRTRSAAYASYNYDYDRNEEEDEFTPYSGIYRSGNGESVYAFQGEGQDLTACDKECGYCGRCSY